MAKVDKTGSCWIWNGARKPSGYGNFYVNRKYMSAHRASYTFHFGEIPEGKVVMHSCDNPSCVNPNHLRAGSHKENVRDMINKGRADGVPRGSEYTPCCKLTWVKVREIRLKLSKGIKQSILAKEYEVSAAAISCINMGATWRE